MPVPKSKSDIADRGDIERLVGAFYEQVVQDPLIGALFTEVARIDLAAHLPVMADFWEGSLLTPGVYRRNALRPHQALHSRSPLRAAHFERWLELWASTVHSAHAGPVAEQAVARAQVVAAALLRRTAGGEAGDGAEGGPALLRIGRRPDNPVAR